MISNKRLEERVKELEGFIDYLKIKITQVTTVKKNMWKADEYKRETLGELYQEYLKEKI